MNTKYLSLAALLVGCSNAAQQTKVTTPAPTLTITAKPAAPDCRNLDLTQKVGFSTRFDADGDKYCYRIDRKENHFYDQLYQCDEQYRPMSDNFMIAREFAGPRKGEMQINAVRAVEGDNMDYIPFWRDPQGKITSVPHQKIQPELEDMFYRGRKMLDMTKNHPYVCLELLDYNPKNK